MTVETEVYTFEGGVIYPFNPIPEQIRIEDIARGLGNTCRWGGQVREFYSVAEHSIMVACQCSDAFRLWGLLHDAPVAYLGDVEESMKGLTWYHVPDAQGVIQRVPYIEVAHRLLQLVLEEFAPTLVRSCPDVVTQSDLIIRRWEYRELVDRGTRGQSTFVPMSPGVARETWLGHYHNLANFERDLAAMDTGEPAMPAA